MRRLVIITILALLLASGGFVGAKEPGRRIGGARPLLGTIGRDDLKSLPQICECEFYAGLIDGTTTVLATWQQRQRAVARVNGQLTRFELAREEGDKACQEKADVSQRWHADSATIALELQVKQPGAEACWYEGRMRVTASGRTETVRVTGACGC